MKVTAVSSELSPITVNLDNTGVGSYIKAKDTGRYVIRGKGKVIINWIGVRLAPPRFRGGL